MHRTPRDDGFTLVELMVVVLIIAILLAIAIPVFLGARVRAQDRSAQADLRNTLVAARGVFTEHRHYGITPADLRGEVQVNRAFVQSDAPALGEIGFVPLANSDGTADQAIVLVGQSQSTKWFCIADEVSGSNVHTSFGTGASGPALATLAACTGGWD